MATYLGANSATALAALVQWGVIELHPWGSRTPRLDRPDRIIFDFDPDEKLAWKELVTAVGLLRSLLDEMKLVGFLKTTGGKGLHVVLPIRATLTWDDAKSFSRAVADFLVRTFPDRFTATVAKEKRKGKIFIDYLRNSRRRDGDRAVRGPGARQCAGCRRRSPGRSSSAMSASITSTCATFRSGSRVAHADPWARFGATRQTITAAMKKRLA